jgi:hypothetical protein
MGELNRSLNPLQGESIMVRYVLKVGLCALTLSTVGVLGACGDDDSTDGTEDDGDDGSEVDAGDDDDGGDEPDAGDGADSGADEYTQTAGFDPLGPGMPGKDSTATMVRTPDGAEIELTVTNLTPGNVYTMWWVIYQNPEECLATPDKELKCAPSDTPLLGEPELYSAVQSALVYAGPPPDGGVEADDKGTVTLTRSYAANTDPAEGIYLPPKVDGSYWEGLVDPPKAEIHVAIRDHGPPEKDPEAYENQRTTFISDNCDPDGEGPEKGYACATVAAAPFPSATLK